MQHTTLDSAYDAVRGLADDFHRHRNAYFAPGYSEAQARQDFVDKFLTVLGWDVNHSIQRNPFEQEVRVERNVGVGHTQKRADYAFFVSPNFRDVRFYVEAKKPSASIESADNYFQAIRYGWNSNTPIAFLTDFASVHVLDCRYTPDIATALESCPLKFHYSEYADKERFAALYYLLSREAVAANSLEKFSDSLRKRKSSKAQGGLFKGGDQSIDEVFLEQLDGHRELLARHLKSENPDLNGQVLTEITQRILDRLVFLRFLEDKLIETEEAVRKFGDRGTVWGDFKSASRRLDVRYNGIVYKEHRLIDSNRLRVDDVVFERICNDLSDRNSPYNFDLIPIYILGSIYERFLGKVIVTTAKRAAIEEKPEVRKAGGVYYTPEYVVRYLVQSTVGKRIKDATPAQIAKMKFADIACGSGSFMLGVFDLLLRHHRDWYNANPKGVKKGDCWKDEGGIYRLTLSKRREILLNNIFGVDIDAQAVEVAQLSLYLKLLEEETTASAWTYQHEMHVALLPALSSNVACGNSLVGTDIAGDMFDVDIIRRTNAMDFGQAFPSVMRAGGFDVIVSNPPYGASLRQEEQPYLRSHYVCQSYQLDSYLLFIERAVRELLRPAGYLGMIIPNPWLTNIKQGVTRRFVNDNTDIQEIVHFTYPVFKKATVHTEMIVLKRAVSPTSVTNVYIVDSPSQLSNATVDASVPRIIHEQADWRGLNGGVINIFLDAKERQLAGKIAGRAGRLDSFCSINVGVKPYQVGKGTPEQTKETVEDRPFDSDRQATKLHRVILRGTDLRPYVVVPEAVRYLKYGPWLAEPRPSADFNARPKILVRQTGDSLIAAIDADGRLAMNNIHVIVPSNKQDAYWIVALLNSKVLNWYYQTLNPEMGEALAEVKKENVAALPLALSESQDTGTLKRLDHLAKLAETMIDLTRTRESHSHSEFDRDIVARQVAEIRRKVDDLVFELYNLDEAEVQVIERAAERVRTARTEDDEDRGRAFFGTGDELASVMTKPAS